MQVFKLFLQIMRAHRFMVILYVCIFVFFTLINANSLKEAIDKTLSTNLRTAVFDNDNSEFSRAFRQYIDENADIVELEDDEKVIKDALFYQTVDYVVYIPYNFQSDMMAKKSVKLSATTSPGTTTGQLMEMMLNSYVQTAAAYADTLDEISMSELIAQVNEDLSHQTDVSFSTKQNDKNELLKYVFNFSAYSVIAISIYIFGAFIFALNKDGIKQRIDSSSITQKNIFGQVIFAAFVFSVFLWIIINIVIVCYFGTEIISKATLLMSLNLLIIILVFLALSYLLGILIKDERLQDMTANTLSLALSFASGVFVPLEILGSAIKSVASFTPTYWYVKANDTLGSLSEMNMSTLKPVFQSYMIELGFLVAILACALVVMNIKRKQPL